MVDGHVVRDVMASGLSVLALSSRFDGHLVLCPFAILHPPFSTRSVESF